MTRMHRNETVKEILNDIYTVRLRFYTFTKQQQQQQQQQKSKNTCVHNSLDHTQRHRRTPLLPSLFMSRIACMLWNIV